jgi:hypothetical protein
MSYISWHIGEIHIVSPALRPNLQRNYLEESEVSRQFIQKLRDYYAKIEAPTRAISEKRKAAKKLKADILAVYKTYQGYDNQINEIFSRQALVELTSDEVTMLTNIQQTLLSDEQNAESAADAKETKIYAHLKDKDVKELRKKLLKKLGSLLVSATQKKTQPPQSSRENLSSSAGSVSPNENKTQNKQPDNSVAPLKSSPVGNGRERIDNSVAPSPTNLDIGVSTDTSLQENRGGDSIYNTPPSATEASQKEETASEEVEIENTENETFSGSTSRKIPVVIVIGFLENILNEELPKDSDVKSAILNKLTEKIDKVLSNVE